MRLRDGKQVSSKEDTTMANTDTELDKKKSESEEKANLEGDYNNVALLLLLYILQGIPLGMAASIPMILQNKKVNYKQQAMFSLVYWPFSLKLLWAPFVDAAFFRSFGRRKTWLVPVQYLIALFMLVLSAKINDVLEAENPNVILLTVVFFSLNFLAATQDIAVDGWALTMLHRRNVGYASTCNSVGQTAGWFIGNVVLLAFSSPDFSNKYIRSVPQDVGLVTLSGFLFFWGIVFLITTTLVMLFKREENEEDVEDHGVMGMYMMLLKIFNLPAIKELALMLLTVRIGTAAADSVTGLKLIEAGVKKESLAMLAVPLVPLQIILPLIISKFTAGPRPLNVYANAIPFRLLMGLVFALLVYWTPFVRAPGEEEFPYYYFFVILFIYALHQVAVYSMFVSIMAFHAKVSDPTIGGTYMTLLNTISNLGSNWPATLVLWLVDPLTMKQCTDGGLGNEANTCSTPDFTKQCTDAGGKCNTYIDGYYIESISCVVIGFMWLLWRRRSLQNLQSYKATAWKVT